MYQISRPKNESKESSNISKLLKLKHYQREILIVVLLLIVFLVVNIATSSRAPAAWLDEVMFTDPAVNLYFGNGFTSTAWSFQTKDEFWAGNVPLHSILLYHWMKLFGFTVVAVRSINYVFMVISGLMLWLAVIRLNLVTSSWSRIYLIAVFLLGQGITFNYRTGRYDCLTIFLSTVALLIYSIESIWLRCVLLTCVSIFFPIAGLQMLPYIIILCCLLIIYIGKSFIRESVSIGIGLILGMSFLYTLYSTNGVWEKFMHSVQRFSVYSKNPSSSITKIIDSLSLIPITFFHDHSSVILLILLLLIAFYQIKNSTFKLRSPLSFALVLFLILNVLIPVVRNAYVGYYSWMSFVPLAICTSLSITEVLKSRYSNLTRLFILVLLVLSCLVGFPRYLAQIVRKWDDIDYAKVENLVQKSITKDDIVYSDFSAFYPIKERAIPVVFPTYLRIISNQEKEKISVLIFDPRNENRRPYNPGFDKVVNKLGGEWYDTGYGLENKAYHLRVYRRKNTTPKVKSS